MCFQFTNYSKIRLYNIIFNEYKCKLSQLSTSRKDLKQLDRLVISCKRKTYNHYSNQVYNNLDKIVLASKGWKHSKSYGDYFDINPDPEDFDKPQYSFQNLNNTLLENLKFLNITSATSFQFNAIPAILSGQHTLMSAETGCGKTVTYLLPILNKIMGSHTDDLNSPKVLILVPNRELAYQIGEVTSALCKNTDLKVKVVVGGKTKKFMLNPSFSEVDVLIGTPGAIGKLSSIGIFKLNQVQYTVLDESDTLLDDSFFDRIESILKRVAQTQLVLVSATLPKKFPEYLNPYLENMIEVKSDRLHRPLLNVAQRFLRLSKSSKPSNLLLLANKSKIQRMIVFSNKNETCNWVALFLRENGIKCSNINGDMNFAIRIQQWNDFINEKTNILSATDIGSRGLNTTQVTHVLNYDFPLYAADYIHRIGRAGRLGSSPHSKVTNFISNEREIKLVQQIELAIRRNIEIPNVDGNITNIIQRNVLKQIRDTI